MALAPCLPQLDGKARRSGTIQALALPRGRRAVAAGARCSVAGWGLTRPGGQLAGALRELAVRVLDTRMCNNSRFWHGGLVPGMLCLAAEAQNQAPCKVRGRGGRGYGGPARHLPWGTRGRVAVWRALVLAILRCGAKVQRS